MRILWNRTGLASSAARMHSAWLTSTLILTLTATGSAQSADSRPSTSPIPEWQSTASTPEWYANPPQDNGIYRFALVRRSNLEGTAQTRAIDLAEKDARTHCYERLLSVVDDGVAMRVANAIAQSRQLVEARSRFRWILDKNGRPIQKPGNSIAEAWTLWEVTIHDVLQGVDAAKRGRIERILHRAPKPWLDVDEQPDWVDAPPEREGYARIALVHGGGEWHKDAREAAMRGAREGAAKAIEDALRMAVDAPLAAKAAKAAMSELHAVEKALRFRKLAKPDGKRRYESTAWVLWEVPVWKILEGIPKPQHERARAALSK